MISLEILSTNLFDPIHGFKTVLDYNFNLIQKNSNINPNRLTLLVFEIEFNELFCEYWNTKISRVSLNRKKKEKSKHDVTAR